MGILPGSGPTGPGSGYSVMPSQINVQAAPSSACSIRWTARPQDPRPRTPDPNTPDPKTPEVNVNNFHHATFYIKALEDG